MDKPYKITLVQRREPWKGQYGVFDSYALQLEGVDGWVEKSQKEGTPSPKVGDEIFGHLDVQTHGGKTYQKFKSGKPQQSNTELQKDVAYIIMMLEELTLRRQSPESPTTRDVLPSDDEVEQPIDLSEIPF